MIAPTSAARPLERRIAPVARGIVALAADPDRSGWNTRSVSSFELAEHYDLTDVRQYR